MWCLLAGSSTAQTNYWQKAKGPYGGWVGIVVTNANTLYAANAYDEVYKSVNDGNSWSPITITAVDSVDVGAEELSIGPSGIFYKVLNYAGTRKLYRSLTEGSTWELLNDNINTNWVVESPTGVLLANAFNFTIIRSADGGVNWSVVLQNADLTFNGFVFKNNYVLSSGLSTDNLSTNNGLSWVPIGNAPSQVFSEKFITSNGAIFSVPDITDLGVIYRTTTNGANWDTIVVDNTATFSFNNILELNSGRLLLAGVKKIYFSDDNGVNWAALPTSIESPSYFHPHQLPSNTILGTIRGTLFRSENEGASWNLSCEGMHAADTKQLALVNDSLQYATTLIGLWKTVDAGEQWERILPDTGAFLYSRHPIALLDPDSLMVSLGRRLFASSDGGQSFSETTPNNGLAAGHLFAAAHAFFTTDTMGVIRSGNFGASWNLVVPNMAISNLSEHPSGTIYALLTPITNSSQFKTLWKSNNQGNSWEAIPSLLIPDINTRALQIDANGTIYVTGFYNNNMTLAISADEGTSWAYQIIPDIEAFDDFLAINNLGQIFTSGTNQQILTSIDQGQSWYYLPDWSNDTSPLNGLELDQNGVLYIVPSSGPLFRSTQSTLVGGIIKGSIRRDADADCSTEDAQQGLKNWIVTADGPQQYTISTGIDGQYAIFADSGTYNIKVNVPQALWWSACDSVQTVLLSNNQIIDSLDFSVFAIADCPLMSVTVGIPQLRRCFDNTIYFNYCNAGAETADSAYADVTLDPYFTFIGSQQPYLDLGNQQLRFFLGAVSSGECGQFALTINLDCDSTVLGQTHCVSAHAYPDTLCTPVPGWSGAYIEASASCQDTTIQLVLQNKGTAASQKLDYIILEDDVVLLQDSKQYNILEDIMLQYPANGHTWRIESMQEPGHPFSNLAIAFSEGCGGFNSLGYINQYALNGWELSKHTACRESTGSFDPNDKQGFPLGYNAEHLIRPGQSLEYLIRFQNTGTDTAFTVILRDTLSASLNPTSIRTGVASHPYTWSLSGQGILSFYFNNIALPDSNVNEPASHGFVSFTLEQQPDLALGTVINNSAAIYFDYNEPVITNTTHHTIGLDYISSIFDAPEKTPRIGIAPNPATTSCLLDLPPGTARVFVADASGKIVQYQRCNSAQIRIQRRDEPNGLYFLRAENQQGRITGTGIFLWE
ncbi:MAG: DUF11 domain-containing protein [Lewinellaceae bacterium]|nr:DUF11 domain-containing protein [Lewinellaceae bacterium]